ncbi:GlxA family transcriptional regulator [Dactylosporangium matsuzakiense]|uniref:GlxA family transcriptional regulator n=1 Tax=Dactylosporangium matsuzakiense TaxID=53360 RepID=UPI0021C33C40|nr:helix-turn-helix domain-containing protein [Dactylosporangium matsuzakiense]UWZ40979.1 helix-turn-helix domain-containing protein [Dactylosporangium matsuzakiense]
MALRRVAAYVPDGVASLGLGLAAGVFRARPGLTGFDFAVCAERRGPVGTDLGVPVVAGHGLGLLARADLVLVLPGSGPPAPRLPAALRRAHAHGATVAAHCLGVFALAASGLLDGLAATTHWQHAGALAAEFPAVTVRPEHLYIDEGRILTGAGAAAGLDLYLHLIRRDHGAALANAIARLLVVAPHRDGGQQQYVEAPVPAGADSDRLAAVLTWMQAHLGEAQPVDALAARALMSRRSFIRYFRSATGTTPHAWLRAQRLNRAEELLETTTLSTAQIAARTGYRSAAVLREQFAGRRGLAPSDYRRAFSRT